MAVNVHPERLERAALAAAVMVAQRVTAAQELQTVVAVAVALVLEVAARSAQAALAVRVLLSFRYQQPTTVA